MENYPTAYDGLAKQPASVFCSAGQFIRWNEYNYSQSKEWDAGALSAYCWNQLSRSDRLNLLVLHWKYHDCNGFKHNGPNAFHRGMREFTKQGEFFRYIPIRVDDLPTKAQVLDLAFTHFNVLIPDLIPNIPNKPSFPPMELTSVTYKLGDDTNILKGDKIMPNDQFHLYQVAVMNRTTGEMLVPVQTVTAKTEVSAHNKAVGLLSQNLPEGKTLDEVLDEIADGVYVKGF